MSVRIDILLDDNGDFPIDAIGVMPTGYSDRQHIADAFDALQGEWKQFLANGIGVMKYLKASGTKIMFLKKISRTQLQNDGYNVGNLTATFDTNNKLTIRPNAYR